jgi:hypothetical protein
MLIDAMADPASVTAVHERLALELVVRRSTATRAGRRRVAVRA